MLLSLFLAASCVAMPDPDARLLPDEMFRLQVPYRYHVRIVENVWHPILNRYELEVTDLYANELLVSHMYAPVDKRFMNSSVFALDLKLEDVLRFPNDRYLCQDVFRLQYELPMQMTITDRQKKTSIWPPAPDEP